MIPRLGRLARALAAIYPGAAIAFAAAAVATRLTVRDRWIGFSTLFYASPPAVPALLLALAAAILAVRRRPKGTLLALGLSLAFGAWFLGAAWRPDPPPPAASDPRGVRLLLWNVGWGSPGWDRVAWEWGSLDADVLALVESGRQPDVSGAKARFPRHRAVAPGGGLRLLVRGGIRDVEFRRLGPGGRAARAQLAVHGRRFEVFLCDLESDPLQSRGEAFAEIEAWLGERPEGPRILLGDFNTPPDSAHFDRLRPGWRRAFEVAGSGWDPTWPLPVPVLALDQIWSSPEVEVRTCRGLWTTSSDHRPLYAEFSIP